jgi:hypothetical protein
MVLDAFDVFVQVMEFKQGLAASAQLRLLTRGVSTQLPASFKPQVDADTTTQDKIHGGITVTRPVASNACTFMRATCCTSAEAYASQQLPGGTRSKARRGPYSMACQELQYLAATLKLSAQAIGNSWLQRLHQSCRHPSTNSLR